MTIKNWTAASKLGKKHKNNKNRNKNRRKKYNKKNIYKAFYYKITFKSKIMSRGKTNNTRNILDMLI